LRGHTLKIGEQLRHAAAVKRAATAAAIAISTDSTFIRSRHDGERHLEGRVGNVETPGGGRQVFAAVSAGRTSSGASRAGMAAWPLRYRHQGRRSDAGKFVVLPNHHQRLRGGRHA
jgi:hypothetical protein